MFAVTIVARHTIRIILTVFLAVVLMLCARVAAAQYHIDSWTTDHGLSHNIVVSVQQTRDGYIWMATFDGLVRFDGVRFTVFDRNNSPGIRNNRFTCLYEAADGAIWAGTEGSGVTRYAQGVFTTYATEHGLTNDLVRAVTGDAAGNVWVLVNQQILQWDGARFRPSSPEGVTLPFYRSDWNPQVWWASDRERLYRFTGGELSVRQIPPALQGLSNNRFEEDAAGTLWMGTMDGRVARITGSAVRFDAIPDLQAEDGKLPSMYADRNGHQWPLTVSRSFKRFWSAPQSRDTLISVNSVLEDREGNIWLGADGQGLYRIRQPRVTVYSRAQGLIGRNIYPVLEDRAGSMWLGVWPVGVSRVTNGHVVNYTIADGLASGFVTSLAEDPQGRVWAASHHDFNGGLRVFENGRFREVQTLVPPGTFIHAMLHDRAGILWLGTHIGLVRYEDGVVTTYTTKDGLPSDDVKTIIEAPDGRIWVGTFGGLTSWHAGVLKSWTERDGLPGGVVRSLYRDDDGVLWIGTYDGGLGRYKDGRFSRFTTREGLYDNGVFQILEDRRGYLWMCSNRGIHRVSKSELNAVADGKANRVTALSLGRADGLLNAECNGGTWPAGSIGANGTLWLPTQDGVVVIDPETIVTSSHPVPPHIESVLIDRAPVPVGARIRLEPGQEALEIQYTGLSLVNSDRIRFRYRLNGLDHDWVDAGTRRTAYYSHIPPGNYTFTVMAAGSDGVWTSEMANLAVSVVPPFWRTWWFLGATFSAVAGLIASAWRYRALQTARVQAARAAVARQWIASQEEERKRIAAELHDSLGQSLIIMRNWALLAAERLPAKTPAREEVDEIATTASRAIREVREIAYDLGPYHLDRLGLAASLAEMTRRVEQSSKIRFTTDVGIVEDLLTREAQMTIYRVAQEAINNIVKHSQATEAVIRVGPVRNGVMLTVEDNGQGFAVKNARVDGSGFGVAGMAERARLAGGTLGVHSSMGTGSRIEMTLPLETSA